MAAGKLLFERCICSNRCLQRFYRLKLSTREQLDGIALTFRYDVLRFDAGFVERMAGYFTNLFGGAFAGPESQVSRLPLLGEEELQQLVVEWNRTSADYPSDKCFHQLFEEQAAATPDRPALRFNDEGFRIAN